MATTPEPLCFGPFALPVKARGNKHLGRRTTAHWSGEAALVKEQKARVRAALRWWCPRCGEAGRPYRQRPNSAVVSRCNGQGLTIATRRPPLPPYGPDNPVDALFIRIPSHGGGKLDPHDGLPHAFKAAVDEVAYQLWPKGPDGEPIGRVDDSAAWFRWSYGQRPHRKPRKRPRPGDPPPDPPNRGTELCEIWLAPREDCRCNCAELRQAARAWARARAQSRPALMGAEARLHAAALASIEPCGCGRSTLLVRWQRGEL